MDNGVNDVGKWKEKFKSGILGIMKMIRTSKFHSGGGGGNN